MRGFVIAVWVGSLLIAPSVQAQFQSFSTTDDGQQVYFSSSLTLKNTAPSTRPELRVYRVAGGGVELFAERSPEQISPAGGGSGDGAALVQVSGDGRTVGYTLNGICAVPSCTTQLSEQAVLRGNGQSTTLGSGSLRLSRNGQWAVLVSYFNFNTPPATLINLRTGERTTIPQPATEEHSVASDGTVVVRQSAPTGGFSLGIMRAGQFTPLAIPGATRLHAISDDGRTLVLTRITLASNQPGPASLVARSLVTGQETILFTGTPPLQFPIYMGMSNDGQTVLYRREDGRPGGPAFLANVATGASEPILLLEGEAASAGTLSGFGNTAYLATTRGRMVQVRVAGGRPGEVREVVPETPYLDWQRPVAAGSLARVDLPFPASELARRPILLDGRPLPVLFPTATGVAVQVPWEARTGAVPLTLSGPSDSPFQQTGSALVTSLSPQVETLDSGSSVLFNLKIVKEDFSGVVTEPLQPNQIVHMYFTGLGRVAGAMTTGVPAGPAQPIMGDFRCRFLPHPTEAETLFAGLAPGLLGIYQVTLRLPAQTGTDPLNGLECRYNGPDGSSGFRIQGSGSRTGP